MKHLAHLLIAVLFVGCGGDELTPERAREAALAYAKDDIACTTDADCCTVADYCKAEQLVVAASDSARVGELIDMAKSDSCSLCIVPAVQVSCQQGFCRADPLLPGLHPDYEAEGLNELMGSHCGSKPIPAGWSLGERSASSWLLTVVTCEDTYWW